MRQRIRHRATRTITMVLPLATLATNVCQGQMITKTEHFDADPGWDAHNNRATTPAPQSVTQNFGYKTTSNAGGAAGEIGGLITPAAEPAYYAKSIPTLTLNDSFSASGKLKSDGGGNTLLGFFNSNVVNTNEWRTPNSLVMRIYGRGSYFLGYSEYGTSKWRAGATMWVQPSGAAYEFSTASVYQWSLSYNPAANAGGGAITTTLWSAAAGTLTTVANLDPGHKLDGATFDRFGFLNVMKSYDGAGGLWVDDLVVNGASSNFNTNPGFVGVGNQTTFVTPNVRPRFDFGYSATGYAGGAASGELGGATYRGDSRNAFGGSRMAYYGDSLQQTLTLQNPLVASGKVAFKRGVSDSTTLIGFFHSTDSIRNSDNQSMAQPENFLGVAIEGPSADGFNFYPTYGLDPEGVGSGGSRGVNPAFIYPDDLSRDFSFQYDPLANGGAGRITVTLGANVGYLNLAPGDKAIGAHYNRFGIITTQIDGNGQTVYFDDLTYTTGFTTGPTSWIRSTSGDWNAAANWSTGVVPNGVGAVALLGPANAAATTVYTNAATTLGTLRFDSPQSYVLAGAGSLTLKVSTGSALVDVLQGSHKINLPLTLASSTTLSVATGAVLKLSDPVIVASGGTLHQAGGGSVVYESTLTLLPGSVLALGSTTDANTIVMSGASRAELSHPQGMLPRLLRVEQLSLSSESVLELCDNAVALGYVGDPSGVLQQVRLHLQAGRIRSTSADSRHSIAYADNTILGFSEILGNDVESERILVALASTGDANLDGAVDITDLSSLATNWQTDGTWVSGDFNYDGHVDVADLSMLAVNWQVGAVDPMALSLGDALSALGLPAVAVPEPVEAAASLVLSALLLRRRSHCK